MKFHIVHFLVLSGILLGGALSFFYAQGNQPVQLLVGVITSVAYVAWGVMHHAIQGDLHPKVVIEYALIGVIAVVLLMIVFRS